MAGQQEIRDVVLSVKMLPGNAPQVSAQLSNNFKIGALNVDKFNAALDKTRGVVDGIIGGIFNLKNLVMGLAMGATANFIKGFMVSAGEVEDSREAFDALTKSAGFVADTLLNKVNKALDGTVDKMQLMKTVNFALLAGLPATADDLALIADAAQRLGKVVGMEPSQAFDELTNAMSRNNERSLKRLGIMMDLESAEVNYAKTLKKERSELTEQEQRTVFYTTAMTALKDKMTQMGPEILNTSDKVAQLGATWKNWIQDLQMSLIESGAFDEILQAVSNTMKSLMDYVAANPDIIPNMFRAVGRIIQEIAESLPKILDGFKWMIENAGTLLKIFLAYKGVMAGAKLGGMFGPIGGALGAIGGGLAGFGAGTMIANTFNTEVNVEGADVSTEFNKIGNSIEAKQREQRQDISHLADRYKNGLAYARSTTGGV
jgi:hypothetical protein